MSSAYSAATGLFYFPAGSSQVLTVSNTGAWRGLSSGAQPGQDATMNIGTLTAASDFTLQGLGGILRMGTQYTFAQTNESLLMRVAAASPVTAKVDGPGGVSLQYQYNDFHNVTFEVQDGSVLYLDDKNATGNSVGPNSVGF